MTIVRQINDNYINVKTHNTNNYQMVGSKERGSYQQQGIMSPFQIKPKIVNEQ